jgi:hypothetical protein
VELNGLVEIRHRDAHVVDGCDEGLELRHEMQPTAGWAVLPVTACESARAR